MNLFFVHTPFQLLVAQSICEQEGISDNRLVLCYSGKPGEKFYDVFRKLIINKYWIDVTELGDINAFLNTKLMINRLPNLMKKVGLIIHESAVSTIYLGDINHPFYALITAKYSSSIQIVYFEEGLSHYAIQYPDYSNKLLNQSKKVFLDWFLFRRLGVKDFSNYLYLRKSYGLENKIFRKFSIIPQPNDPKYVPLNLSLLPPEGLITYFQELNRVVKDNKPTPAILFLSTSAESLFANSLSKAEFLLQALALLGIDRATVFIKLHPKEKDQAGKELITKLQEQGHAAALILNDFPYPIELIFGNVSFDAVIGFDSSSLLYAQAFNVCKSVYSLTPLIVEYNRKNKIDTGYPLSVNTRFRQTYRNLFGSDMPVLAN
jgi:hypothetical protein